MSITEQISRKVVDLPPAQQRAVLEFAETLRKQLDDENASMGEAARILSTQILQPEDFSHWKQSRK